MPSRLQAFADRRFSGDSRGTVSIEFAILVPVFLAILFGIIVFGIQYATRIALTYAAAEGGRAAVAGLSDDERKSLATGAIDDALQALSPLVNPDKATVTDKNPFQKTEVTVPLTVTEAAYAWREVTGGVTADYVLDRATRRVGATANGEAVPLSNPQCGKSARLVPR